MKFKLIFLFSLFFYIYAFSLYAINVRVLDLQLIINNNKELLNLISKIEQDQSVHRESFQTTELELQSELQEIDELKLILETSELEKEINIYNDNFKKFNEQINKFNSHYENQINVLKNNILENILEILKEYSLDNQIDLILDSNNYILSSNSINITNIILDDLNKLNTDASFEKFK